MTIRPFDWRDLPALHRYRHQSVFLNTSLLLTRGPLLIPGALLSSLAPAMGVFTSVSVENEDTYHVIIGQIIHTAGTQCAQLTFLAPDEALESDRVPPLLDHLSVQAVNRGAFRLLVDVDDSTIAFEALRKSGFGIYARQRIWRMKGHPEGATHDVSWQGMSDQHTIAVRSLYNNIIPGLVQQVEPYPNEKSNGLVYRRGVDVLAYAEIKYGHRGIWVQPFVHPEAEEVAGHLIDSLQSLPYRLSRPIYLCIRSYQSWLEPVLQELGAEPGPRQAMMVKHLAIPKKALRSITLPALDGGQPEVTAPITRSPVGRSQTRQSTVAQLENK